MSEIQKRSEVAGNFILKKRELKAARMASRVKNDPVGTTSLRTFTLPITSSISPAPVFNRNKRHSSNNISHDDVQETGDPLQFTSSIIGHTTTNQRSLNGIRPNLSVVSAAKFGANAATDDDECETIGLYSSSEIKEGSSSTERSASKRDACVNNVNHGSTTPSTRRAMMSRKSYHMHNIILLKKSYWIDRKSSTSISSNLNNSVKQSKKSPGGHSISGDFSFASSVQVLSQGLEQTTKRTRNQCKAKNTSADGSWGQADQGCSDDHHMGLPGRRGFRVPCYWSKKTPRKHPRGGGICLSPSVFRKGVRSSLGSRSQSFLSSKGKMMTRSARGVVQPLLSNGYDGRGGPSVGTGCSDDELSINWELYMEAMNRLDGRRWSPGWSQEALKAVAANGENEEERRPNSNKSLSQKYRPMFFHELIGQNIVVQSLVNAISRGEIAPAYFLQGPRGTGKTCTAKIFAAALNCVATEKSKPCGYCRECADFISDKDRHLMEIDGSNEKGINKIMRFLRTVLRSSSSTLSPYKIFVIDECHLLASKTWLEFLRFLEDPPPRVVFVLISTEFSYVPRIILSRCQQYVFGKLRDEDIVIRLRRIASEENLDAELDALKLIASNADGSLRDAEYLLNGMSLLGERITASSVQKLAGVVSEEKLLELAMLSDNAETAEKAEELMGSGVDPMILMPRLAKLIVDFMNGNYEIVDAKAGEPLFGRHSLTHTEEERLKHAHNLLKKAEKQEMVSSNRSQLLAETLLQLHSVLSLDPKRRLQSIIMSEGDSSGTSPRTSKNKLILAGLRKSQTSPSPASFSEESKGSFHRQGDSLAMVDAFALKSHRLASTASNDVSMSRNKTFGRAKSSKLDIIWEQCIAGCHLRMLKQLLHTDGELASISEAEGLLIAYIAFRNGDAKSRAETFLPSIKDALACVLRHAVDVRIILLADSETFSRGAEPSNWRNMAQSKQLETAHEEKGKAVRSDNVSTDSDVELQQGPLRISQGRFRDSESELRYCSSSSGGSTVMLTEGNGGITSMKERKQGAPMLRIESDVHEQWLQAKWSQAGSKRTYGAKSHLRPEKHQILPHDAIHLHDTEESMSSVDISPRGYGDEINCANKFSALNDGRAHQKNRLTEQFDQCPMSPSLLHNRSSVQNFSRENLGYESASRTEGCGGLFCWNKKKLQNRGRV